MDIPVSQLQPFFVWWWEELQEVTCVVRSRRDRERVTLALAWLWQALQTAVIERSHQQETSRLCFPRLPRVLSVRPRRWQLAHPTIGFSHSPALQDRSGGLVCKRPECGLAGPLPNLAIETMTEGRKPPPSWGENHREARGWPIARRSQRSAGWLGILLVSLWVLACSPCRQREVLPCPLSSSLSPPCPEQTMENAPQILTLLRPTRRPDPPVQDAQRRLHQQGYDPGPLDGVMGEHTRAALRQFQRHEGLTVTGNLDPKTKARLSHAKGEKPPGKDPPGNASRGEREPTPPPMLSSVPVY